MYSLTIKGQKSTIYTRSENVDEIRDVLIATLEELGYTDPVEEAEQLTQEAREGLEIGFTSSGTIVKLRWYDDNPGR